MTPEYPCGQPATSPLLVDTTKSWMHSIVSERDFMSPWEASSRALDLSFELSTLSALGSCHNTAGTHAFDATNQRDRKTDSRSLSFCDAVEVLIGIDDCLKMVSNFVQHRDLCQASSKPWGWFYSADTWQYDPQKDQYQPIKMNRSALEPQSTSAVSIRQTQVPSLLRITDQWHHPLPDEAQRPGQADEEQEPDPDVIPDPIGAPTFIHDLFELAERHRVFTDLDHDGSMRIRTWYLHHQDARYCEVPRFLEFEEDWRRWEIDIGQAWRDHIRPNEVIMIHVVFPDSFRGYLNRPVHADVIISQGQWLNRFSTLSTIHHYHRHHPPHSYAVACSLPRRIGGIALADAARVLYWCNLPSINCRTSYEWHDIPFTVAPTHEVSHGHAFNINILDALQIDRTASASDERPRKRQFQEIDETSLLHQPQEDDMIEPEEDEAAAPDVQDYDSSSLHSGDISLLIYRLSEPDAHSFAPSTTYVAILEEAIRACRTRRRDTRCFHYVHATPTGVHSEAEEVIILQSIYDVAPGSDEKLVLLDLEIHFHPLRGGLLVPAAASRKVIKVNPTLHRDQLLLLTGLFEHCRLQHDRCTIFKDNEIWAAHDIRAHTMAHGMYLKIQVPPPQDPTLDTEIAIAVARDLANEDEPERNDIAAMCRQRTSALSLRQLGSTLQPDQPVWEQNADVIDNDRHLRPTRTAIQFPQRQLGRFAEGHEWRLTRLCESTDLIECEEEGRIMYITVWFVHHRRQVRCAEGRSARLHEDPSTWLEDIADTWRESLDPHSEFVIHVVQPTPPCSRFECVQAHIIIEQSERQSHTICLISSLDERRSTDAWTHSAFSTSTLQSAAGIIRLLELTTICRHISCSVTLRDFPLSIVDFEELDPALNIVLKLRDTTAWIMDYDTTDLMQQTKINPVQNALDMTGGGQECEGYATAALNPLAPPFHPNRPNFWDQPADIQALHAVWQTGATDWQGDSPEATFLVWFLCPGGGIQRCLTARRTTLQDDVSVWRERLIFTWRDQVLTGFPVEIHVVQPTPFSLESGITAHIILTQLFMDQNFGVLLSVQDNAVNDAMPFRIAVNLPNPGQLSQVLDIAGYANEQAAFTLRSGTQTFGPTQLFPTRHGKGLHLLVYRQNLPQGWMPPVTPAVPGAEGLGLLQTRTQITRRASARLTHGTVAQAHGPEEPCTLELDKLIIQESDRCAVRLISGHAELLVPTFLEIESPPTELRIEQELLHWGIECKAIQFGTHDKFLCIQHKTEGVHYMLCNEDLADTDGCILHSHECSLDTIGLMALLDKLGYARAVVTGIEDVGLNHTRVIFCNNDPQFEVQAKPQKVRSAWPSWQNPTFPIGNLYPHRVPNSPSATNSVETDFKYEDVLELLTAGTDFLNTNFDNLNLPEFVQEAVCQPCSGKHYDRWLIYTDGSSQSSLRHTAPLQADDMGHPDSWAMLVLGETLNADGSSTVEPIGWCAHPVHYDPNGTCYTHAQRIGAEVAEREALIWAGLWRLTQDSTIPTIFCCDSLTCGSQAFGLIGVGVVDESYRLLRGIFQCLEHGLPSGHLRLHHVRSHAGDPYNEFVDWAAKQEATGSFHHRQMPLDMQKWNKFLPHFWLIFGQQSGLPRWQDGQLVTCSPALPVAVLTKRCTKRTTAQTAIRCTMSIATANVLSLSRNPEGQRGKLHYLFAQMKRFGLNVIGLQECRSDEGHTTSNNILRYMSGHRQGQEGVEIWINLDQPIATTEEGKPCYLAAHHCLVTWKDPRRLLLRVVSPFLDGWFFAAHAPHSGKSRDEREAWWAETTEILQDHGAHSNCFWLIDANAEPGPADGITVFCRGTRTSTNTILFKDSLHKLTMCLPATSHIHHGDRDTWTRPDGEATFCIDHIVVPQDWREFCTRSEVLYDFDLATTRCDHQAVGLELSWWLTCETTSQGKRMPKVAWHDDATRQTIKNAMNKVQVPDWKTDVETQEHHFSSQIAAILGRQQRAADQPKKCYIDEEIWEARSLMIHSQKRLKKVRQRLGREALWQVFNAWKTNSPSPQHMEHFQYGTMLRCDALLLLSKLRVQRRQVRHKLKKAKAKQLEKCLEQVNEHTAASSILHILRSFIGPTNPKKQKKRTLPMLEKEDGTICATPEEAMQVWIKFFADMEGGKRQTEEELHTDWLKELTTNQVEPFKTTAIMLPSLADLELAYRRVAIGKATGPDQVPGELCHHAPSACARATYSSLWKLLLFGHEALQYKGGLLVHAYKGKGPTNKCSSYRSLLISSHIAKSLHRTKRSSQATVFESFLQAQQLGGRRAMPVTYGVHLARAFQRQARHQGHSCALIMLDLKEAFYRIFRPLCMDGPVTDQALAHLMQRLQMPADAMVELRRLLCDPCALEQAGLTSQQCRSIRTVHSQTFFWMHHQRDVVQTTQGSRPGDPFADIIFSYVWAVVLKKLQAFMQQQGIISEFVRRPTLMLFEDEPSVDHELDQFIGPTWMDDLCVCVEGSNPAQTIQRTTLTTGRLLELCIEHCMTPNLQPNKTEILFSLRGAASRRYKKEIYGTHATGSLPIVCEYGTFQVPVTSRYCHLG